MSKRRCCVCKTKAIASEKWRHSVSLHMFPANAECQNEWIRWHQSTNSDFKYSKSSVMCSRHFEDHCFENQRRCEVMELESGDKIRRILRPTAVPSIRYPKVDREERTAPLTKRGQESQTVVPIMVTDGDDQGEDYSLPPQSENDPTVDQPGDEEPINVESVNPDDVSGHLVIPASEFIEFIKSFHGDDQGDDTNDVLMTLGYDVDGNWMCDNDMDDWPPKPELDKLDKMDQIQLRKNLDRGTVSCLVNSPPTNGTCQPGEAFQEDTAEFFKAPLQDVNTPTFNGDSGPCIGRGQNFTEANSELRKEIVAGSSCKRSLPPPSNGPRVKRTVDATGGPQSYSDDDDVQLILDMEPDWDICPPGTVEIYPADVSNSDLNFGQVSVPSVTQHVVKKPPR